MALCPDCGIKLTQREMDLGVCDICNADLRAPRPRGKFARTPSTATAARLRGAVLLQWASVRGGLMAVIIGLILTLVAGTTHRILSYLEVIESGDRSAMLVGTLTAGLLALVFWGLGSIMTGCLMCNAAPTESGARNWSVFTSLFLGLLLVCYVIFDSLPKSSSYDDTSSVLGYTILGLALLASVSWNVFLTITARLLEVPRLGSAILIYLLVQLSLVAGLTTLVATEVITARSVVLLEIAGLILIIWQLVLVAMVRSQLSITLAR